MPGECGLPVNGTEGVSSQWRDSLSMAQKGFPVSGGTPCQWHRRGFQSVEGLPVNGTEGVSSQWRDSQSVAQRGSQSVEGLPVSGTKGLPVSGMKGLPVCGGTPSQHLVKVAWGWEVPCCGEGGGPLLWSGQGSLVVVRARVPCCGQRLLSM